MKKRLVSILLAAVLLAGSASAAAWPDWASSARTWAEQVGLSDTLLQNPSMTVTRGQAAQMLYEAAGSPACGADNPFNDVPQAYADAVTWAADSGYVQGVGDDRYAPGRAVTRQEFAVMLYRGAGQPDPYSYTLADYADRYSVADWAWDAMRWCVGTGLVNGKADGLLAPSDTIKVVEAATMLQRRDGSTPSDGVQVVSGTEGVKAALLQAMRAAVQPPVLQVRGMEDAGDLEIAVRNAYYALLSAYPELKYAYDLQVEDRGGGLLCCTFSYMPYHTGDYPAGFAGQTVSSLRQLIDAARNHLSSSDDLPIRITDSSFAVDDMNRALQQAGGGYVLCQLNRDGTAITFTPQGGLSYADCVGYLEETDVLADAAVAAQVRPDMTQAEKAEALYTYLTELVLYDHRYYSDPANMPFQSQTAYGALHDHLAICGGYAQALQLLFEKAGIPCYTVSGSMGGENHMWNVAYLDGAWQYFDATSDRGRADYWFNYCGVTAEQLTRYVWDADFISRLTRAS